MNWFSVYQGNNWDPRMHGYNELFKEQIIMLEQHFRLQRATPGVRLGTGYKVPYTLQGDKVTIAVKKLQFDGFIRYSGYIAPQLVLDFVLQDNHGKVLLDAPLIIEFQRTFPSMPPRFRVNTPKYTPITHEGWHTGGHIYSGGWLCIMGGFDMPDWHPDTDTIITAMNCAFDLIVWHIKRYGW